MKERISYESKLKEAGADLILNTVNDLKNISLTTSLTTFFDNVCH